MKSIDEILALASDSDIITNLKQKDVNVPSWETLKKEWFIKHHDINDRAKREDKLRDGKIEYAARIGIALEQYAVRKMTEFMFAIPVKRFYSGIDDDPVKKDIVGAIEAIYKKARINTENIRRSKAFFASCEICTFWYVTDKPNSYYGFKSQKKLTSKTYSPMDGYELYPLLDEYGDMIAMSVQYTVKSLGKENNVFETFTKDKRLKWVQNDRGWDKVAEENIILGKIPMIYVYRESPIWEELGNIRNDIEFTVSRNSDVIAYNAAPVLAVKGLLKKEGEKGAAKRVYQVEKDGDINYVSWEQAIEALKYHVDTLLRLYFMQLQLPDLSFDNMKGLMALSGEARKTLLTDPHLKVGDESGDMIEFLEREGNIIKAYLKILNPAWSAKIDEIDIEHEITPFIQNDEQAQIDKLYKANGNKPLISQREAIEYLGFSTDIEKTYGEIKEEENEEAERSRIVNLFQGAE